MAISTTLKHLSSSSLALLVFLFITPSLSISLATTSSAGDTTHLQSASELDYPPFAIVHPDGTAGGFSVDLLTAAVRAAGLSVDFKVAPWNQIKEELARGELDVLPLVSYSRERDKIYDFTAPYLKMSGTVFVRKGYHEIKTISDLKDKEVLVMQGDTAHDYILRNNLTDNIITTPSFGEAFLLLAAGKHDAIVVQQIVGLEIIKELGLTNIVAVQEKQISSLKPVSMKLEGFEQKFCFAVPEGNQHLLSLLNEGLAVLYVNGTYNSLYQKWFTPILPQPEVPVSDIIKQSLQLLIPILFLLTLTGLWYLKRKVAQRTYYLQEEIQRRELIEKKLADANSKYIKAQQLGKVGNWDYDIVTQEFHGSSEAIRMFGFVGDTSSLTVETVESCIPERERVSQALVDLIENNVPYNLEYDIITADRGERKTVNSLGELERDEFGNPVKIQGVILDITERRKSETALRENVEMLRALVEGMPDIVSRFDRDGRHLFVSENIFDLVGMDAAQFIGKTHRQLGFPEEKCIFWEKSIKKAFDEDIPLELEFSFEGRDGQVINNWRLVPEHDAEGRVESILSINRDVSAHKKAERDYQLLFREMLEGFALHEIICDDKGAPIDYRFLTVNPSFERMTGLVAEKIVGRTVLDLLPGTEKYWIETYGRVALSGEPVHFENYSSELKKYFETTAFRPAPNQFACIVNDITERKIAEEEIRHKDKLLSEISLRLPGLVFQFVAGRDGTRKVSYVTGQVQNLLGLDPEPEGFFERFTAAIHPDHRQDFLANIEKTISRKGEWHYEGKLIKPSGEVVWISGLSSPTEIAGNLLYDGVILDITEHRVAEEEKDRLQAQLQQAQKMESVGRLAGGVAHDFNNMLGVILGHAEMIMEKLDPALPIYNSLEEIRKAGQRSADLTRQLLAFARKQTMAPRVLDLNQTLEGMLQMLRRLIGEDIDLAWRPGKELASVYIDPSQLDQMLANLCVNSRDAIADVGKITIETGAAVFDDEYCSEHVGFAPGEFVLLAVSDDGCGMDQKTQAQIFEPFFTTKEQGKGTGLGLATVYGIVKQNDGFINVYSEPGQGTTFKIYLPRHIGKPMQVREDSLAKPDARGHETILLVEDEAAILKMTTTMLELLGYNVVAASSPGKAIRLASKYAGHINLLMTDVVMPEMNGRDLAKNLLLLYPNLNRLFMSGYTANVIAHHGVLDKGVNFIQKPFSKKDLAAKVKEALNCASE